MNSSNSISINFKDKEGVFFEVPSSTDENIKYNVHYFFNAIDKDADEDSKWICTCPGNWYGHKCKHIKACETLLAEVME